MGRCGRGAVDWMEVSCASMLLRIFLVGVLGGVVRAAEPVTLVERGGTVVLDNGIVRAEVDRATGTIDQVGYRGKQLLMSPAYVDWVATEEDSEAKVRKVKGVYGVTVDPKTNGGRWRMCGLRFARVELAERRRRLMWKCTMWCGAGRRGCIPTRCFRIRRRMVTR